jgi:hypothetical protein
MTPEVVLLEEEGVDAIEGSGEVGKEKIGSHCALITMKEISASCSDCIDVEAFI